jgi:hypothetical protein
VATSVGVRIQGLTFGQQTLALGRLAASRAGGECTGRAVLDLYREFALPPPAKISNVFTSPEGKGFVRRGTSGWLVTPKG